MTTVAARAAEACLNSHVSFKLYLTIDELDPYSPVQLRARLDAERSMEAQEQAELCGLTYPSVHSQAHLGYLLRETEIG